MPSVSMRPQAHTTLAQKLAVLGCGASLQATSERIEDYRRLFAYRYTGAIVTRVGQGPRAWTKLPKRLGTNHIIRHLLGDCIPGLEPVWFGARGLSRSWWFCLDVDADRSPSRTEKPTFAERLVNVQRALRRMGIDPDDPRQVLPLPTPSGGRHLYVFLDAGYHLEMIHDLLESAGLKHTPGEVEIFPAVNQGLRLPFGFIPGQPHRLHAWIQFIDDYRNGRIHRFSVAALRTNLDRHCDRWARQAQSVRIKGTRPVAPPVVREVTPALADVPERYRELLARGIHTTGEAEELLALGVRAEGTRTQVLKHLAAHLVWFRHRSADEAAAFLTTWAMDSRHRSKDIAADLAKGTTHVAAQIANMCRWYGARKQTSLPSQHGPVAVRFALSELERLLPTLQDLDSDEKRSQAGFLLYFLAFAKRHGKPTPERSAWDAAPAINAVVRKWPDCSHMNYKTRIGHAVASGVLTLVKDKWQNPSGKGRARTYRLHVPVPVSGSETLDHATALGRLTGGTGLDGGVEGEEATTPNPRPMSGENGDAVRRNEASSRPDHSPALLEEGAGGRVGTGPRQRDPERHAADRLPGFRLGHCGADHGSGGIDPLRRHSAVGCIERGRERLIDTNPDSSLATVPDIDDAKFQHAHPPMANSPSPK